MRKEVFLPLTLILLITVIFFYPIVKGYLPFPGDLLVGGYTPYNSYAFFGYAPGGFPNKGQSFDVLRLLYPTKEFSINMLKSFQWPLWNPYNFSGTPHIASLQSGTFYPLNFLWVLPSNVAWTVYIMLQPLLAALFTYLLLRELKVGIRGALFGGISFAFSSFMVVWMEYGNFGHAIIWLPLAMWLCIKNIQKITLLKSTLLISVLSFSIVAGYIQISFYIFIFLFIFILFNIVSTLHRSKWLKHIVVFMVIFTLPLLLTAVQLLPMVDLILQSTRSSYTTSALIQLLIPQFHLVTLFAPDFFGNPATQNYWIAGTYIERVSYIGILPLFFLLFASINKPSRNVIFFISIAIGTYLLAFDTFLSRFFYSLQIPFIFTSVPTRIMFIFCFATSILAGFGFDNFEKGRKMKNIIVPVCIMGIIYLSLWIFIFTAPFLFKNASWIGNIAVSKRNLLLPSAIFIAGMLVLFAIRKWIMFKNYLFIVVFVLTIFDLFYFFHKITPFAPAASLYPKTEVLTYLKNIQGIDRSWGYGSARIDSDIQTHEKIYSTDGYDPLHIKRYGELVSASKDGKIANPLPVTTADVAPGYGESDLRENSYRQRILNLLGVKYILYKNDSLPKELRPDHQTFSEKVYRLLWQRGVWQIYENKQALPRFFLVSNYIVEKDQPKIVSKIFDTSFNLHNTVILEEYLPKDFNLQNTKAKSVKLASYTPNRVVFQTVSSADTLLFLSDNYFPGWKVSIDDKPAKIYRADYAFRVVGVQKGRHTIVFIYYPDSFVFGLKISLLTILSGLLIVMIVKIKSTYA